MTQRHQGHQDTDEVNVRSEEVQDIVDRMPTRWAAWTALITGLLIATVFALGFFIKYPDTVIGQISITTREAPIRLVASTSGRLHLLVENGRWVSAGTPIGYVENGADYGDFNCLERLLDSSREVAAGNCNLPPRPLSLGEMSTAYNNFVRQKWHFDQLRRSPLYTNLRSTLEQQVRSDEGVVRDLGSELKLKEELLASASQLLHQDSLLLTENGISRESFQSRRNDWLQRQEACLTLKSNRAVKESDVNKSRLEIAKVRIQENEELQQAYSDYLKAYNDLLNAVRIWRERYLAVAPMDGRLEYLDFWRENKFVESGRELFTIIPTDNQAIGEVQLSAQGAGKVKVGQEANVKLTDYPYTEFGKLTGHVASISRMTQKLATQNGSSEAYLVIISFPEGIKTNFGKRLILNPEAKGSVEIVTKPKRLIHRLFDNLKAKSEK